jgi:type III secretion system low calcium response chaperone LcrH/SycD
MISRKEIEALLSKEKVQNLSFEEISCSLFAGKTYQDILGFSNEAMQACYDSACSYLHENRLEDAADCFLLLATLNPLVANIWLRLGNCCQALDQNENALEAYSMAMLADANDPFPHYYSAQIYLTLESYHEAKKCLEIVQELIKDAPEMLSLEKSTHELLSQTRKF